VGETWEATLRGEPVAVTVVNAQLSADVWRVSRLFDLRPTLLNLRHPNLASLHELSVEDGRVVAVQDLVEPATVGDPVSLASGAASALAAIHGAGLVHGHLSPGNLLVGRRGVQLTDVFAGPLLPRGWAGHRDCTAPEVTTGGPLTPASDLFALGAALSQLVPEPSTALAALIAGLTDPNPNRRPVSAALVAETLSDLPAPPVPPAPPIQVTSPMPATAKRTEMPERGPTRWPFALLAAVALIAAAVFAWPDKKPLPPKTQTFVFPAVSQGPVTVQRTWTLTADDRLQGSIHLSTRAADATVGTYDEVLPASLAVVASGLRFAPSPAAVIDGKAVLRYRVRALDAGHPFDASYEFQLSKRRPLSEWVSEQQAQEPIHLRQDPGASVLLTLTTLVVDPPFLVLHAGQQQPLTLQGTLSTGAAAPAELLALAVGATSDPAVATYANGVIQGVGAGQATVTVSVRGISVPVAVTTLTT
jgi:hypothetical protein